MARKKKNSIPEWAYQDNPYSNFGLIYCDLLKSKQFQQLSPPEARFLMTCYVHARDEKAYGCLLKHTQEKYESLYGDKAKHADDSMLKDWRKGYFVFPAKQLQEYGYSSAYGSKLLNSLCKKGFIEKLEDNSKRQKVNVYRFSARWKKQQQKEE